MSCAMASAWCLVPAVRCPGSVDAPGAGRRCAPRLGGGGGGAHQMHLLRDPLLSLSTHQASGENVWLCGRAGEETAAGMLCRAWPEGASSAGAGAAVLSGARPLGGLCREPWPSCHVTRLAGTCPKHTPRVFTKARCIMPLSRQSKLEVISI